MIDFVKPLYMQFELHNRMVNGILSDAEDKSFFDVSGETINPPLWLLVHIIEARAFFGRLLGVRFKPYWGNLKIEDDEKENIELYPEIKVLKADWQKLSSLTEIRLEEITEDELAKPFTRKLPIKNGAKSGVLTFMISHESYHIGQLAAWWKKISNGSVNDLYFADS